MPPVLDIAIQPRWSAFRPRSSPSLALAGVFCSSPRLLTKAFAASTCAIPLRIDRTACREARHRLWMDLCARRLSVLDDSLMAVSLVQALAGAAIVSALQSLVAIYTDLAVRILGGLAFGRQGGRRAGVSAGRARQPPIRSVFRRGRGSRPVVGASCNYTAPCSRQPGRSSRPATEAQAGSDACSRGTRPDHGIAVSSAAASCSSKCPLRRTRAAMPTREQGRPGRVPSMRGEQRLEQP